MRYADVQKYFHATPVFSALKVNSVLATNTPTWSSLGPLEEVDSTLGAGTYDLLLQRAAFEACKKQIRHPKVFPGLQLRFDSHRFMWTVAGNSFGGKRYILRFLDEHTRNAFVYFLKHKSEVSQYMKNFITLVETQTGDKMKDLRLDYGTKYVNRDLENFLKDKSIRYKVQLYRLVLNKMAPWRDLIVLFWNKHGVYCILQT